MCGASGTGGTDGTGIVGSHKLAYCASDDVCLPIYSPSDSPREASTGIRTSLGR
ncbi:hypothetical protein ES703_08140 [subsurface metagenome]